MSLNTAFTLMSLGLSATNGSYSSYIKVLYQNLEQEIVAKLTVLGTCPTNNFQYVQAVLSS